MTFVQNKKQIIVKTNSKRCAHKAFLLVALCRLEAVAVILFFIICFYLMDVTIRFSLPPSRSLIPNAGLRRICCADSPPIHPFFTGTHVMHITAHLSQHDHV